MTLLLQYRLVSSGDPFFFAMYLRGLPVGGLWVAANNWIILFFSQLSQRFFSFAWEWPIRTLGVR